MKKNISNSNRGKLCENCHLDLWMKYMRFQWLSSRPSFMVTASQLCTYSQSMFAWDSKTIQQSCVCHSWEVRVTNKIILLQMFCFEAVQNLIWECTTTYLKLYLFQSLFSSSCRFIAPLVFFTWRMKLFYIWWLINVSMRCFHLLYTSILCKSIKFPVFKRDCNKLADLYLPKSTGEPITT